MRVKKGRFIIIASLLVLFALCSTGKTAWSTPFMTSPLMGTTLNCGDVEFSWAELWNPPNYSWKLYVGTTNGGDDIFNSGDLGNSTSVTVSGIPGNGNTVYLTLWYQSYKNPWQNVKFTYTAASNCGGGDPQSPNTTGGGKITQPLEGGEEVNTAATLWSQKIPGGERFEHVLDGQAVLDNETGLVWEQEVGNHKETWERANDECIKQGAVGGRYGWHLPTVSQLGSLVDETQSNPKLPYGHPFTYHGGENVWGEQFWTHTTAPAPDGVPPANAHIVDFATGTVHNAWKGQGMRVWCVRGGKATEYSFDN